MHYRHLGQIATLALLMGLLGGIGCSAAAWRRGLPRPSPKTDVVPGLVPPHEQISTLRRQRDTARSLSPAEASRLSSELANRYAEEQDPLIRAEIVKTLGALGTSEGRRALRAGMQDSNSDVR
ncbi:MAG: HEAT repeat domain-containing protein [Pirellulales bacterium]|nr:HEAT repeat domain-containing protein [Pirellulales bacterium]